MDYHLICQWLGLPSTAWPPDHYTLLGLPPGEADCARIEQHTQERLMRVRCYQISHAEQATEAMNRLAQAFVCLTDPTAKQRYDAGLGLPTNGAGPRQAAPARAVATAAPALLPPPPRRTRSEPAAAPTPPVLPAAVEETAVIPPQTQLDWTAAPPPVRLAPAPQEAPPAAAQVEPPAPAEQPAPAAAPSSSSLSWSDVLPSQPADPLIEAARSAPAARRGLGTRRALFERVLATRQLLRAWDVAGRYLGRPKRRLTRPSEEAELARRLTALDELLLDFPPLLGQPGQPGYRVVSQARDEDVAGSFKGLDLAEREALALDWRVGRAVLVSHLQFVRQEVKTARRQGWLRKVLRPARAAVNDYPGWSLLGVVLAFAAVAAYLLGTF